TLALFRHDTSLTVRANPSIKRLTQDRFEFNRRLFLEKWPAEAHRLHPPVATALNQTESEVDSAQPVQVNVSEAIEIARSGLLRRFEKRGPRVPLVSVAPSVRRGSGDERETPMVEKSSNKGAHSFDASAAGDLLRLLIASNAPWVPSGYG